MFLNCQDGITEQRLALCHVIPVGSAGEALNEDERPAFNEEKIFPEGNLSHELQNP